MNFFTTLLVFLLTWTVSHALPSDDFCTRFGEVIRYCLKQKDVAVFRNLEPSFNFENYETWSQAQYALDHIGYRDWALDSNAAGLYYFDLFGFGAHSVDGLCNYLFNAEYLPYAIDAKYYTENGVHVVHLAAVKNNLDALKEIVSRDKMALQYRTKYSNATPLHMAVMHGSDKAVRFLLQKGADVLAPDASGLSPLELATWSNHDNILKAFIYYFCKNGLSRPHNDKFGVLNATIVAVRWGYLDVAAFLNQFTRRFYQMFDPDTGCSLLHLAANYASGPTISGFLKSVPISSCNRGYLPHFYTVLRGEVAMLPTFDADTLNATGASGMSCLDVAVLFGDYDLVKKLVTLLKPSKEKLLNATFLAIRYNLDPIVKLMRSIGVRGTDIYRGMRFYEYIYLNTDKTEFAKWIRLCRKKEWETFTITGLRLPDFAVFAQNAELLESLLATGLDCCFCLANGIPALLYASGNRLTEIELILKQRIIANFRNPQLFLDAPTAPAH